MSLTIASCQKLSSSTDFREKILKALQYFCKLLVAIGLGKKTTAALAKHVSSCRRLVTFLRCVKYADSFREAEATAEQPLRGLLYAEATLNVTVDTMCDVVTLEKLGLLGRLRLPGAFGMSWEKVAEVLDALLAAIGSAAAALKLQALYAANSASSKLDPARLALVGYIGDLLKNIHSAGADDHMLGVVDPGPLLAAIGGLTAASLSARKIKLKLLPAAITESVAQKQRTPVYERSSASEAAAKAAELRKSQ